VIPCFLGPFIPFLLNIRIHSSSCAFEEKKLLLATFLLVVNFESLKFNTLDILYRIDYFRN